MANTQKPAKDVRDTIIQFVKDNFDLSYAEISAKLKEKKGITRTPETLRKMYAKYAKDSGEQPKRENAQNTKRPALTPEQQFQLDMEALAVKRQENEDQKQYKVALKEVERLRIEREKLLSVSGVKTTHTIPSKKHPEKESVAVVVFSDWHVEENVKPETVDFSNEYTMDIAQKRAQAVFRNALTLVKKEQDKSRIDTMIVALLGDFFSGHIHDELMETCEVSPVDAAIYAQQLIADGIQYLLDNSKLNLIIPCCVGNHSRTTDKVHVSTEQGNSLEWMIYKNLAVHFKGNKRVTFVLSRSYFTWVNVLGFDLRFHHGHAMKYGAGVGGITIPINKAIARYDLQKPAYLDIFGHFHHRFDGGKFIANGSLIGNTPYGTRLGFTGKPEQSFFLIREGYGKTVVAPIFVE
jgi:hypothetical protein